MNDSERLELETKASSAIRRIINGYAPDKVILFGSFARGDYHEHSDVDLLIIKETTEPFLRRLDSVLNQCTGDIAVESLVYTPSEFDEMLKQGRAFLEHVMSEGRVVYEKPESN